MHIGDLMKTNGYKMAKRGYYDEKKEHKAFIVYQNIDNPYDVIKIEFVDPWNGGYYDTNTYQLRFEYKGYWKNYYDLSENEKKLYHNIEECIKQYGCNPIFRISCK